MSITHAKVVGVSISHLLNGNLEGTHKSAYDIRKAFEARIQLAVLREQFDPREPEQMSEMISAVYEEFVEPELAASRNFSPLVDEFLPSGQEYYVRDAIRYAIEGILED